MIAVKVARFVFRYGVCFVVIDAPRFKESWIGLSDSASCSGDLRCEEERPQVNPHGQYQPRGLQVERPQDDFSAGAYGGKVARLFHD